MQSVWIPVAKAAPALDTTEQGLYRMLRENLLPPEIRVLKIGRQYRINAADLGLGTVITDRNQIAEARADAA